MIIDKNLLYCAYKNFSKLYEEYEDYEPVVGGMLTWALYYTKSQMTIEELSEIITMCAGFRIINLVASSNFGEFINKCDDLPFE